MEPVSRRSAPTAVGPIRLPTGSDAPSAARLVTGEALAELGMSCVADSVTLLVSEIVTNSVVHADCDHITLTLTAAGDRVRVETLDCDPMNAPQMAPAVRETPGGFGLRIVDAVSAAWGVVQRSQGKVVWFEVALPQ